MGEARYYLKARWETPRTEQEQQAIIDWIKSGEQAADWWQVHRMTDKPDTFWPAFEKQFPLHFEMLGNVGIGPNSPGNGFYSEPGDCNNSIAGHLCYGYEDDTNIDFDESATLLLWDAEVWHFADWETQARFLREHFGAYSTDWLSDEYANDYYGQLNV